MTPAMPETVTVLRARGRRLAKLVRLDGTVDGYEGARVFDLAVVPVADLDALAKLLTELLPRRDCAIVRGGILDPDRVRRVRRLVHPCPVTGDAPTLLEQARAWVALDLDGLPLPAGRDVRDLAGCGAHARAALPSAFQGARMVVQASGSHGIKPGARLRLWAWLDRALTGPELRRWLHGAPIDHAVFRPAQLVYTSAPAFVPGARDPLPVRLAWLPGDPVVRPPSPAALAPPPVRPARALPDVSAPGAPVAARAALTASVSRVANAPVNSRHYAMVAQARTLAGYVSAGLLTEAEVRRALGGAAERCGKTAAEAEAVWDWAQLHPRYAALPREVA